MILEQVTQILLSGEKEWVQQHWPTTLTKAVKLMEDYLVAEVPDT